MSHRNKKKHAFAIKVFVAVFGAFMLLVGPFSMSRMLSNTETNGGRNLQGIGQAKAISRKVSGESHGAEVWVINQPKSGTGAMQGSVQMAWKCGANKKKGMIEYPCPNDSVLYRTHQPKAATEEKKPSGQKSQLGMPASGW